MSEKSKDAESAKTTKPDASVTEDASVPDGGSVADASTPQPSATISDAGEPLAPGLPCNGHESFCKKRYNEWCQAATHDSVANSVDYWKFPAQNQPVRGQLDNGIRALMLNVQDGGNVVSVCRGSCVDGSTPLAVVLTSVKEFLDANPREIVTLFLDTPLGSSSIEADFTAKGLNALAHTQALGAAWPTLGELVDAGHRLVVFASTADTGAAWLLPRKSFIWETGTDWKSLIAMNCNPAVGDTTRPLYLVHHNLIDATDGGSAGQPSVASATQANAFATVTARLQACTTQYGRAPNFVAVDYFNVGDPLGGSQVMNGVRNAP